MNMISCTSYAKLYTFDKCVKINLFFKLYQYLKETATFL